MLSVKLTKIESSHTKLRTTEVEGKCTHVPEVGEAFTLFANPLVTPDVDLFEFPHGTSSAVRIISTTEIKEASYDPAKRLFTFTTQNSTYQLEVFGDKDPMEYARWKKPT